MVIQGATRCPECSEVLSYVGGKCWGCGAGLDEVDMVAFLQLGGPLKRKGRRRTGGASSPKAPKAPRITEKMIVAAGYSLRKTINSKVCYATTIANAKVEHWSTMGPAKALVLQEDTTIENNGWEPFDKGD